ncbi:hypothetical protein ACET3Z_025274 [Daucus carota]
MNVKNIASFLIFTTLLSCFISETFAIAGRASWYATLVPSTCFGGADEGNMVVAIPQAMYDQGYQCGQMLTVSCQAQGYPCKSSESINVKIVEKCTSSAPNIIALYKDAFAEIADPGAGSIPIEFS